jgi:aminopeptidase N
MQENFEPNDMCAESSCKPYHFFSCFKAELKTLASLIIAFIGSVFPHDSFSQDLPFKITRDDTLRGSLSAARTCYDVTSYDLSVAVDVKKKFISGSCIIRFNAVRDFDSLQVDLFARMKIDRISFKGAELKYRRELNSVFVKFPQTQSAGQNDEVTVFYSGNPLSAKNPPWDGGFVWKKDNKDRDWIGVACEGLGASCWWPCKDQLADEPDSMSIHFTVPTGLTCVANGRFLDSIQNENATTTWNWFVSYPINIYNVTFNLGHYAYFTDSYISGNNKLLLNYYVLDYNLSQAELHFQQVKSMMSCYEKYFGPYPFWRDGYKLVETPYWGMEHQSAIAYGNDYINNKQGFDYIIIHESAHEWWGNNVSANDYADLWIHESFATYAEALYMECTKSYDDAVAYLKGLRWEIRDTFPVVGIRDVNFDGSRIDNDMYFKGAWMIHTFRSVLNNDSLFFRIIKGIQQQLALETVSTRDVIACINKLSGKDYTNFFQQYLYYAHPPIFEYKTKQKGKDTQLTFRWKTDVTPFTIPVEVTSFYKYQFGKAEKEFIRIQPTSDWQTITIEDLNANDFDVNTDRFYIRKVRVK